MKADDCVVYRVGGTGRFSWRRGVALKTRAEAEAALEDIRRMGYAGYVEDYARSMAIGLPETWE